MQLSVSTWNINSVRLRIDQVRRFLERRPDVLCLQETKCPNDRFPLKELQSFGYPFVVHAGQKGYNGVAILSRLPVLGDERHGDVRPRRRAPYLRDARAGGQGGRRDHDPQLLRSGRRRHPGPDAEREIPPQAPVPARDAGMGRASRPTAAPAILVGDLNVAPLEHDVWSHKQLLDVVSHTPVETAALEELRQEAGWTDAMRSPAPAAGEGLFLVELPLARLGRGQQGPPPRPHLGVAGSLRHAARRSTCRRETRGWDRALRPRAGDGGAGALEPRARRLRPRGPDGITAVDGDQPAADALEPGGEAPSSSAMTSCMAGRGVGKLLEHPPHQARRDADDRRGLARGGGGRALDPGEQGRLARSGRRAGDEGRRRAVDRAHRARWRRG